MDTIEEIKKLKSLLDQGAITAEEFNGLKKKLIDSQSQIPIEESYLPLNHATIANRSNSKTKKIVVISAITLIMILVAVGIKYYEPIKQIIAGNNKKPATENYDIIYEDGEKLGVLIIKKFTHTKQNNGFVLNIPSGKMWTPLYYEYSDNNDCSYIILPTIFTERKTSTGWVKSSSYKFPEKKDFISYKVSKRNLKALGGEKGIMFTSDPYCKSVLYIFYFLEE